MLGSGLERENSGIKKDWTIAAVDSAWYPAWKRIVS